MGVIWLLRLEWICWLRVGLLGLVVGVRIDCLAGCFGFVVVMFGCYFALGLVVYCLRLLL